jgi:hypothetical protein
MMQRVFITSPTTKSGTTLLCWLIGQHSNIKQETIEEEILFSRIFDIQYAAEYDKHRISHGIQPVYKTEKNIKLMQQLYDGMVNPNGYDISALKIIEFRCYDYLRYWWPTDPIICLLRHPIDWWASRSIWPTLIGRPRAHIKHFTHNILKTAMPLVSQTENIHIVYYEDIITNTQPTLDDIFKYLGWKTEQIDLSGNAEIYKKVSSHKIHNAFSNQTLVQNTIGQGEKLIPDDEKKFIWDAISSVPDVKKYFERYF